MDSDTRAIKRASKKKLTFRKNSLAFLDYTSFKYSDVVAR